MTIMSKLWQFLSYCSKFCQKASKMVKILVEIFWKLELSKMTIMSKSDQNLKTISKVMTFLIYCSNFCRKAPNMAKILVEIFSKLEIFKMTIISKFDQNLPTISKVTPKMVKILDDNFWKVRTIQIDLHTKISLKSDHYNQSYSIFELL